MKYKPDWDRARERLTALWEGRCLDRPCMAVRAPSGRNVAGPPAPEPAERKWLDPGWIIRDIRARLESTWWGGEAVPSYLLMGGWTVCLGGTPHFDLDTIWFDTFEIDFDRPSPFVCSRDDPWIRKHQRLYCRVTEYAGRDDFLVGHPCILPASDLLAMHMGTQEFLIGLVDHPEWMRTAIHRGAEELLRERQRLRDLVRDRHAFWYGNSGWMPFWAPEPYASTQSDVSCMLSPAMFEDFIVPELDVYGNEFGAMWYHLDGGDARQHVPCLLSRPYMRVVQYVPAPSEPPNGPGHLDLYREIQATGVIVHVQVSKENVEILVRSLDPALLMLDVTCDSREEGEELLAAAGRWARSGREVA